MTRLSFVDRLRGTLRLDVRVVQELKMSPSANVQAFLILVAVSALAGITYSGLTSESLRTIPWDRIGWPIGIAAAGWIVWAILVWFFGTRVWADPKTSATLLQELRPLAFATAPVAGAIFLLIPRALHEWLQPLAEAPDTALIAAKALAAIPWVVGIAISAVFGGWALLTVSVAIRHPLRFPNTAKALGVFIAASVLLGGAAAAGIWAWGRWGSQIALG